MHGEAAEISEWVLSPDVQINCDGQLIPQDEQYSFVQLPLDTKPMVELLATSKNCLGNNFISSFITVAGSLVLLHYETVLGMQEECSLILCYSSQSGTGKSTTLRNIESLFGLEQAHITGPDTPPVAAVTWAAGTTFPIVLHTGIDDIRSAKKAESIAVQFFNGFAHNTVSKGEHKPRTSVILTSNNSFDTSERNLQRIIHIPFFTPTSRIAQTQLHIQEGVLKQIRSTESASPGLLISLGQTLQSQSVLKEYMYQEYLAGIDLIIQS